jgi:hypothetical protein
MDTAELTLDEIADLRDMGFDTYMARVIRLFRSGQATPAQWEALAEAMLLPFRTQSAPPSAWEAMAEAVLACSESSEGHRVIAIDRAVLRGRLARNEPAHPPGGRVPCAEEAR